MSPSEAAPSVFSGGVMSSPPCPLSGRCGGCPWLPIPYAQQLANKQEHFRALWREQGIPLPSAPLEIFSAGTSRFRDRVDLTLQRRDDTTVLGLYALPGSGTAAQDLPTADSAGGRRTPELLEIPACPVMSAPLEAWLQDFRADLPAIGIGSLRLRISPQGQRGVWLDFSHVDVKRLMDEKQWLERLLTNAHVEIGQRRKSLEHREGILHLKREPVLRPWFETYLGEEEKPQPLYCTIADFSQPGILVNRLLVRRLRQMIRATNAQRWLELGAGSGNLTLPLLAEGREVTAVEQEYTALRGLERSAQEAGLESGLTFHVGNFQRPDEQVLKALAEHDGLLVDPPRSGLGKLPTALGNLSPSDRPLELLYVSCYAESMTTDVAQLLPLGYRVVAVEGVDQFPHSAHGEWLLHLRRD